MAADRSRLSQTPKVEVSSRAEWRRWLMRHHRQPGSIWLVTARKSEGPTHVPYAAIVEEALCFGWIDSLPRRLDDKRSMLLLSPRKLGSAWSAANKARAERLIAQGLMEPEGLARIAEAKASGAWTRLDDASALRIPADLAKALSTRTGAADAFAGFPPSVRRGILEWIAQAKRPQTRDRRIAETAEKAERGERANQWRS